MKILAQQLLETIHDYRNHDNIFLDEEYILQWATQFDNDAEFILTELNHIIPNVYVSRVKAKEYLQSHINTLAKGYKYQNMQTFLMDTEFLDMQLPYKSQPAILKLIDEILMEKYDVSYIDFHSYPKKNFVYFDDVLATGSTIGNHLVEWLSKENAKGIKNATSVLNDTYKLSVHLFCMHTWGHSFQSFRLKKEFADAIEQKITWVRNIKVENHAKWINQFLNVAFPIEEQPSNVKIYLANLPAKKYEEYAYRQMDMPTHEVFFSSPENRIRYENILLQKGLEIIQKITGVSKPNIRPLGLINPNYKTFGLGTHFFTWRNIPNNCPLVFWWEVPGHDWVPLFPVANRGFS